jgi:hypothetical protein
MPYVVPSSASSWWFAQRGRGLNPGNAPHQPVLARRVPDRATRAGGNSGNIVHWPTVGPSSLSAQREPRPNPGTVVPTGRRIGASPAPRNEGRGRTPATPRCQPGSRSAGAARNEGLAEPRHRLRFHQSGTRRRVPRNEGRGPTPATGAGPRQRQTRSVSCLNTHGVAQRGPGRTPATSGWGPARQSSRCRPRNKGRGRTPATSRPDIRQLLHAFLRATRAGPNPATPPGRRGDGVGVLLRATRAGAEPRQRRPRVRTSSARALLAQRGPGPNPDNALAH